MRQHTETIIGTTWNEIAGGRLWTREWCHSDTGYYSRLISSGTTPHIVGYADAEKFWDAYDAEAAQFHGDDRTRLGT